MATEIKLSAGQVSLVDDDDAAILNQWKWSASRCHRDKFMAMRVERLADGSRQTVYMHRQLLGLQHGDALEADHRNHDTLDNRRDNLRVLTPQMNKRWQPSRGGSSGFVGVTWEAGRNRWRAQIQIDGRVINLGRFRTEVEAAAARDAYVAANETGHERNAA